MKDRLDIAHVIYEWWRTRQNEEDYLNATITTEQYLGIVSNNEEIELIEEGNKIFIKHRDKPDEVIYKKVETIKEIRAALSSCSTCDYEVYVKFNEGGEKQEDQDWYWHRDCISFNTDCYEHFDSIVRNKTSREIIQPVYECPYWKKRIKEILTDYEQTTEIITTSKRLGKKRGKYKKNTGKDNRRIHIGQIKHDNL